MTPICLLCAVVPFFIILCWYDAKYRRLPNVLVLLLALVAAGCRFAFGGIAGVWDGLLGGLVCGLFLYIPFLMRSAGGGDVKMLFASGIAVGFRLAFAELLFVSIAGVLLGIILLCSGMVASHRLVHYLRIIFDWRYDRKKGAAELPDKADEKGRIPFGVAIAVGTVATLIFAAYMEAHP